MLRKKTFVFYLDGELEMYAIFYLIKYLHLVLFLLTECIITACGYIVGIILRVDGANRQTDHIGKPLLLLQAAREKAVL